MNCQPGDLALVISGPNAGKMVTCIRLESPPGMRLVDATNVWRVDRDMIWRKVGDDREVLRPYAPDRALLPIRPGDSCSDPGYEMREGELVCKGCGESAREILEHA